MFEFLKKIINKASPEKKPAAKKEVVKKAVKKTSSAPKKIVAKAPILPKKIGSFGQKKIIDTKVLIIGVEGFPNEI